MRKATPKLYIVLHLYKTAGKTLRDTFKRNFTGDSCLHMYPEPMGLDKSVGRVNLGWDIDRINKYVVQNAGSETRCIYGHMAYFGIHHLIDADVDPRYITFLREPVSRCISLYYHLKNNSQNVWHQEIMRNGWSIDEWFEKSQALWQFDGQLRHLLLGSRDDVLTEPELTREHLEEGKRLLRQFWYIGLTETFEQDAQYLYGSLRFRKYSNREKVNVTPGKREVPAALKQAIAERNALDIELYNYARELRTQFINRHARSFQFNKSKAMIMQSYSSMKPMRSFSNMHRLLHHPSPRAGTVK
jgi:hypothetical protein